MASLFDAVERPRVIINTNDFNKPKSLADAIEKPIAEVPSDGIPNHHKSILQSTVDKLFGLHGEERYQLWPERLVRDAISAPHDVMTEGLLPPGLRREDFTDIPASSEPTTVVGKALGLAPVEWQPNDNAIDKAQAVSALAGTGGLAGVGGEAGVAVGSGPLKIPKKLYRGVVKGQQESGAEGLGTSHLGKGLYTSADKSFAKKYATDGEIREFLPEDAFPKNPLILNGAGGAGSLLMDHIFKNTNLKNAREVTAKYPDLADYVRELGHDGVVVNSGEEIVKYPFLKADNQAGLGVGVLAQTNKPFFSAVENAVAAAKQPKADAQQWLSFLKNQPGVKQEELAHLGLDKLSGSITKDELLKAVQEGQPQIKEVIKGAKSWDSLTSQERDNMAMRYGDKTGSIPSDTELKNWYNQNQKSDTKYHDYQLPGGNNYREMLLTLPDKQQRLYEWEYFDPKTQTSKQFKTEAEAKAAAPEGVVVNQKEVAELNPAYRSSHWDEPNVLAHIRMNDRNVDGKKSLHLEEIQSDWHQEGRKKGYREGDKAKIPFEDWFKQTHIRDYEDLPPNAQQRARDEYEKFGQNVVNNDSRVPDAPFKKTWDELALKKAITEAVKNGYDSISWTPGEAQAARYDLSKQVDAIRANKNPDGTYMIGTQKPGHNMARPTKEMEAIPADKLADIVGKELAEKIIKGEGGKADEYGRVYSGLDLKVGGQGMKAFYDKMLVDKMRALTKKYGGEVNKSKSGDHDVHVLKITPELRERVLKKGFPLFSAGVPVFSPIDYDPFKKDK